MKNIRKESYDGERGVALIAALLATTLMLALGMAVVFSATTDTTTTKVQRVGQQAFFAADGGIGIARRALTQAFSEEIDKVRTANTYYKKILPAPTGQFPDVQVLPPADGTWNNTFYKNVRDRALQLAALTARAQRLDTLDGSKFTVEYTPMSGTISLQKINSLNAIEHDMLRYSIKVTGQTTSGGSATVHEVGTISTTITLAANGTGSRNFKFSGFGAFFDNGDTQASAPLAAGTFSGPVHTNTHFAFLSNRSVTFRDVVSQVDSKIRYDDTNSTTPNKAIPPPSLTGITLSPAGYKTTSKVPLPDNNFSQEYAVINATGITEKKTDGTPVDPPRSWINSQGTVTIPTDSHGNPLPVFDSSGRVMIDVLAANLRDAKNQQPVKTQNNTDLADGVYVSSDGNTIKGAGVYVEGDASDIQLFADTNGDQVYVIQQGSKTTTIRTNFTTKKTTISSGSDSKTYDGVFTDESDPQNPKPGVSLFVDGAINSLRGGHSGTTDKAAISPNTRMTITAQGDITVTGDIKYADQVVESDGKPVSNINSINNVLGIFTNDGNMNLAPNATYVKATDLSLQIDSAAITFNSNTANDNGEIKGSIVYTGSATPGANARWKLVGSRVQSKINNIGYNYRDIFFDTRFSGGTFSPPFFPGTTYQILQPVATDVGITFVASPAPTAMSWFRDNN